jgi:large subunit ribosomal protein L25
MKSIELKGDIRTSIGKKDSNRLRSEDKTPCVLYGGKENVHFSVEKQRLKKLVYTPNIYLVDLEIDGAKHKAILKDLQFHPVTDEILHIDFLEIFDDKQVEISIPVSLNGLAEGVKAGGKLQVLNRKLIVKALPKDLPDTLEIDVTKLALGKSIKVGDVSFENIEMLNSKNTVIASVKLTRAAKGMAGGEGEVVEGEAEEGEAASEE